MCTPKGGTDRCVMATWWGNKGCCARLGWLLFPSSLTAVTLPHTRCLTSDEMDKLVANVGWKMQRKTQGGSSHSHTLSTHLCASCSTLLAGGVSMPSIDYALCDLEYMYVQSR